MTIKCDKCSYEFPMKTIAWKRFDSFTVQYFTCESCGSEYVVSVIDAALRKDIRKVKRMRDVIGKHKAQDKPISEAYVEKTQKLLSDIKRRGGELRRQYQKGMDANDEVQH